MPVYDPITNVMPLASMVTNAVVSAALCDQIRDDLVALYDGWWFKATRNTSVTMPSSVVTPIPLDTITVSRTAANEGSITLAGNGVVRCTKMGIWLLGFHYMYSSGFTGGTTALIQATDLTNVAERNQGGTQSTDVCLSGVVNCTTNPQTFTPEVFTGGTPSIPTTRPLTFWGIWLGDNP